MHRLFPVIRPDVSAFKTVVFATVSRAASVQTDSFVLGIYFDVQLGVSNSISPHADQGSKRETLAVSLELSTCSCPFHLCVSFKAELDARFTVTLL